MTQQQVLILVFKIVLICAAVSVAAFAVQYSLLAPWWADELGRTIVIKDLLLLASLLVLILSIFLAFTGAAALVAGWAYVAAIGLIAPVMIWRMAVFQKIHRRRPGSGHRRSR